MKIATIVGARPQFIKAAVLSREIQKHDDIEEVMIHTGQHYDRSMSGYFFEELGIPKPKHNLHVGSKSHAWQTGEMMGIIEDVLILEKPDCVVVYGDTNSTLAGALAAVKLHIPTAHVEAGLRSFNRKMPEEINRIVTDHICDLLFTPCEDAEDNVFMENLQKKAIFTGDITYDSFLYNFGKSVVDNPYVESYIHDDFYLATIHRPSNTDNPNVFKEIINALDVLPFRVLFPVHPRIKALVDKIKQDTTNIDFIEPVGYWQLLGFMNKCKKVITDSGGVQKEAYFMKKPCITVREDTEYPTTCFGNWNILTGPDRIKIIEAVSRSQDNDMYSVSSFGNGEAAEKILTEITKRFKP